ncbi:MAG: SRPBCC domain-containing protein, partial [bacterium]|nr:SRPBCC domain-containing protein [bacterium]
ILEELDPRKVRFHQNEVFRGILVPMFDEVLKQTRAGFIEMNEALKERAEKE